MESYKSPAPMVHPMLFSAPQHQTQKGKIVSAEEAVLVFRNGNTVATGGFVGICFAEEIAMATEERFLYSHSPTVLTLIYADGQGGGIEKGLNHLGIHGC